jgi:hypothetical protein
MSNSLRGSILEKKILSGEIGGSQLETILQDTKYLGAFRRMIRNKQSLRAIADSSIGSVTVLTSPTASTYVLNNQTIYNDASRYTPFSNAAVSAVNTIAQSLSLMQSFCSNQSSMNTALLNGASIAALLDSPYAKSVMFDNATNYQIFKNAAAQVGAKLKKQFFTSSGTWTVPSGGINRMSAVAIGGGGGGAGAGSGTNASNGGGAGQIVATGTLKTSLPAANSTVSVTIGNGGSGSSGAGTGLNPLTASAGGNGGSSSFGAYATALGATGKTGGFTGTASGALIDITDTTSAILWHLTPMNISGGDGGVRGSNGSGNNAGLTPTGEYGGAGGGGGAGSITFSNGVTTTSLPGTGGNSGEFGAGNYPTVGGAGGSKNNGGGGGGGNGDGSSGSGNRSGGAGGNAGGFGAGGGGGGISCGANNHPGGGNGSQGLVLVMWIEN